MADLRRQSRGDSGKLLLVVAHLARYAAVSCTRIWHRDWGSGWLRQLLDHSDGLLACCREVLAGMDRLEHGRDLPHLGRGHVTEDVAVPVHDAPLPGRLGKAFCGALG